MTNTDLLAAQGMVGADAETALRSLYSKLLAMGKRIGDFDGCGTARLMGLFGCDAGRAAVILTR